MKLSIVLPPVETGTSTSDSKSEKVCSNALDVLKAGDGTAWGTVVPHNKEISGNTNQFRLLLHVQRIEQQLVGHGDQLAVRLIATLRQDHLGELLGHVHVGLFERAGNQ